MDATEVETGVVTGHQETGSYIFTQSTVHTWKAQLPWIPLFNPREPHVITSPLTHVGNSGGPTSWRVQVSHDCWDSARRVRTIGLYLWRLSSNDLFSQKEFTQLEAQRKFGFVSNIRMQYKFEILDINGNTQFTRESDMKFIPEGTAIGGRNFALYDEVVRKNCIAADNTMTIRTTISLYRLLQGSRVEWISVMFGDTKLGEYNALRLMENSNLGKWAMDTQGKILHAIDLQTILSETPLLRHDTAALVQTARKIIMFLDEGKSPAVNKALEENDTLGMKVMLFKFAHFFCIKDLKKICVRRIIEKHLTLTECLRIVRLLSNMKILNDPEYVPEVNQLKAFMRANFEALSDRPDMDVSFTNYSQVYTKLVLEPDL